MRSMETHLIQCSKSGVVCFADLIPYEYKIRKFVAYLVPIWTFFGEITNQNVPCPFHHDNTPSAKLFVDEDKISRLFCYACRQQFTSYDYIKLVLNKNPILYLRERYAEVRLDEQAVYFANNLWGDAPLETGMNWQEIERDVHDMGVVAALNKHYKVEKMNYA